MPRAVIIDPGTTEPAWTDLSHPGGINDAVDEVIGSRVDYSVIHRDRARSSGVHLAVGENSLLDDSPHNDLASRIIRGLGWNFHVHGRCILMGLTGPATTDLTEEQWQFLAHMAAKASAEAAGA